MYFCLFQPYLDELDYCVDKINEKESTLLEVAAHTVLHVVLFFFAIVEYLLHSPIFCNFLLYFFIGCNAHAGGRKIEQEVGSVH